MGFLGRIPRVPDVEIPSYCSADAQVVVHPGTGTYSPYEAVVYYACGGLNTGDIVTVFERDVKRTLVSKEYLSELAGLARVAVGAACETCPFSKKNEGPDSTSDLPEGFRKS